MGLISRVSSRTYRRFKFVKTMERLLQMGRMQQPAPGTDAPQVDTSEQIYISSLALLKMLKHGRAGVPMEVMGLMLGEFVDDYTVRVVDVFCDAPERDGRQRGGRRPCLPDQDARHAQADGKERN